MYTFVNKISIIASTVIFGAIAYILAACVHSKSFDTPLPGGWQISQFIDRLFS